ncbi:TetR family transcriptional regulator [Streptomyces sp. ID05-39B]|uniref:TetR family transcriptional regulator n=1 Tax=Streptomyces sp. ID05-39B TaxID=3028664 RepID=UPI0029BAADB3|nr:TetR family transcriptional regulator [Streptomyces sp. ID05-39B]MDX3527843.1 TetR family transcriptional regulator [Streptomyces sp. ID05-39B]
MTESAARRGCPRDANRDRALLEATLAVLGESGYGGLTTAAVAARAGASTATLYGARRVCTYAWRGCSISSPELYYAPVGPRRRVPGGGEQDVRRTSRSGDAPADRPSAGHR